MQNDQVIKEQGVGKPRTEASLRGQDLQNGLRWLADASQLTTLKVSDCGEVSDFSPLARLTRLTTLELSS